MNQQTVYQTVSVQDELPGEGDCGKDFFVMVKTVVNIEKEACEWFNPDDGEREPFFQIETRWCGQQTITRKATHWLKPTTGYFFTPEEFKNIAREIWWSGYNRGCDERIVEVHTQPDFATLFKQLTESK